MLATPTIALQLSHEIRVLYSQVINLAQCLHLLQTISEYKFKHLIRSQIDHWIPVLVSTLLVVDLVDVRDCQPARVVRLYGRVQLSWLPAR